MVEISLYGAGEGSGWVTAPGYSTDAFLLDVRVGGAILRPWGAPAGHRPRRSGGQRLRLRTTKRGRARWCVGESA